MSFERQNRMIWRAMALIGAVALLLVVLIGWLSSCCWVLG